MNQEILALKCLQEITENQTNYEHKNIFGANCYSNYNPKCKKEITTKLCFEADNDKIKLKYKLNIGF